MPTRFLPRLLLLCLLALPARADIAVIVHPDSPLRELTTQQVTDIYLGRTRSLLGGERLLVLEHPRDSDLRGRFYLLLNGMDLRRVNAYWARLQFSGDTAPPAALSNNQATLDVVRRNRHAIGYVDAGAVTSGVRPILTLK